MRSRPPGKTRFNLQSEIANPQSAQHLLLILTSWPSKGVNCRRC